MLYSLMMLARGSPSLRAWPITPLMIEVMPIVIREAMILVRAQPTSMMACISLMLFSISCAFSYESSMLSLICLSLPSWSP